MTDFGCGGPEFIGSIPGTELGAIESHPAGGDVQESGHDDAGIGNANHPFSLRQPRKPVGDQPIVGPADQFHHDRKIGRGGDGVEQPDGRELRRDQAMGRLRRSCESVRHRNTISLSS
jgi:hypothetical protein